MPAMKTWTANGVTYTFPFAPEGFGLGTNVLKNVTSLSEITATGFYRIVSSEMPTNNAWWGYAVMNGIDYGTFEAYSIHGATAMFEKLQGTWKPYKSQMDFIGAAPAIVEDVSSDFTPAADVISSATVYAYKRGNIVHFTATITPVSLATLQSKTFFTIASRSQPKNYNYGLGLALLNKTDANSATQPFIIALVSNGNMYCPNQGGYKISLSTSSIITIMATWEVN